MAGPRLLQRLRRVVADRGSRWARRRQGPDQLPATLTARRIYILPTKAGAGLAALLLAMLIAGLNYNNSLALLLTFTLTGYALVGMHQCHRRLVGLRLTALELSPGFAGGSVQLRLTLDQPSPAAAAELQAVLQQSGLQLASSHGTGSSERPQLDLRVGVTQRGLWQLPAISLRTRAPSGLFQAWAWLHLQAATPVYPQALGDRPLPDTAGDDSGTREAGAGLDELTTLRAFREGDSPRQVAWKAYARGAPLLVKEYQGLAGQQHEFDFAALGGLDTEARLSQLCQWIQEAERRGEAYGLRLPGTRIAADAGPRHQRDCLTALALYGLPTREAA